MAGLPHYVAYLIVGLLVTLFLTKTAYRWGEAYLAFALGAVGFVVIPFTQMPLQRMVISDWMIPSLQQGASIYAVGMVPALIAGVLQTLLLVALLYLVFTWRNPKQERYGAIGVCLGAAFGFAESCYLLGQMLTPLFSWFLFERAFWIIGHAAIGGLLGLGVFKGRNNALVMIVVSVVINALLRYLPVFVQEEIMDVELARILVAACSLIVLVYAVFALGSAQKATRRRTSDAA
ncbi:hypothetical protein GF377_00140 [candidate division GN15 bacterium]|nr:hypothetical protein [candidate division GN15 bacterium]